MLRPTVFLITGYARAGKDTLANALAEATNGRRLAFADDLKNATNHLFERYGLHQRVDVRREQDKVRHRDLLVAIGKAMRAEDRDVFARVVADSAKYSILSGRSAVVSDWRYVNEFVAVRDRVAPAPVVTIKISRFGLNAANEEEAEHQQAVDKTVQMTWAKNFKDGDVGNIREWAAEIAASIPNVPAA